MTKKIEGWNREMALCMFQAITRIADARREYDRLVHDYARFEAKKATQEQLKKTVKCYRWEALE